MTKEEYHQLRGETLVSPLLFYTYYLDHKQASDPELMYNQFEEYFLKFVVNTIPANVIQTHKGPRHVSYEDMLYKVYQYLNKKFE